MLELLINTKLKKIKIFLKYNPIEEKSKYE
jgi:hypothetical protein